MPDITSTRNGKSNLPFKGGSLLAPTRLEYYTGYTGVRDEPIPGWNRILRQVTTSYRGKRDQGPVLDTPGAIIRANLENNTKPKYDTGHPFQSRLEEFYTSHRRVTLRGTNGGFYVGPLMASGTPSSQPGMVNMALYDLSGIVPPAIDLSKGTSAIAKCEPTRNPFSLTRAAAEAIRDFPKIPFTALVNSRNIKEVRANLGSDYLNMVFGVVPTANDIISFAQIVMNFSKSIEQFERDLGRPVRRQYSFPDQVVTQSDFSYQNRPDLYIFGPKIQNYFWKQGTPFKVTTEQTITEKYWFAGAFEYYLDPLLAKLGPAGDAVSKANQILGFSGSLSTLWELAPWSWLVDWFLNVGDLITLNEKIANDSLVLRYGYLMRTYVLESRREVSGLTPLVGGNPTSLSSTSRITEKQRVRSTPYGFGLNLNALSAQQWAILGALGLSNGNKLLL